MSECSAASWPAEEASVRSLPTVCIIGAGCSGFATAKRLRDHGIPYDCFEMSDDVGGNWYFGNPNGRSACCDRYASTPRPRACSSRTSRRARTGRTSRTIR
ncbi:NAD(P)-binding protein [Amycolatopsis methanolica]|uniref:NAD(P)-binding protein n=1 Tax=Amycolatopsis methanolica TaxID=1814 RepID=UPI001CC2629F|nr:NAD(P)-binding protein [Amycolatopsis methanolica]